MITRSSLGSRAQLMLKRQCCIKNSSRRGLAAAASGSFQYQSGESSGVKIASRDLPGATTTVAVVAKAGTRYQLLPGFADGLEQFAFKNTHARSALRITREVELLGGELDAYHSRESLVLKAKFLSSDLPYFVELLGEVISATKYTAHEFEEEVVPQIERMRKSILGSTQKFAINSAHGVAFHQGLGIPLHPVSSSAVHKYLDSERLAQFSKAAYAKSNIAVVANGAKYEDLQKWTAEFFEGTPSSPPTDFPALESAPTKFFGGEERIAHEAGNTMVIAFPGSSSYTSGSSYKPEVAIVAALLGGESSIKWSPGFSLLSKVSKAHTGVHISTTNAAYSDAGLLYVTLTGSAEGVRGASKDVAKALTSISKGDISKEDIVKATALAKFRALEAGQNIDAGLESTGAGLIQGGMAYQMDDIAKKIDAVTPDQVKKAAKTILEGKAAVSSVGDLFVLPWAEEIGLHV